MDFKSLLRFLSELKENNAKEWMDAHKDRYQGLRKEFISFTGSMLEGIAKFDEGLQSTDPKKCIFRINRDVRFSHDKSPYKTNFGAYMVEGGKKSGNAGYYLHIAPEGESFLGGGIHMPPGNTLTKIRQEIDYNPEALKHIVTADAFSEYFGEIRGEKLKTAPKGYPKDHPNIELLKLKGYTVWRPLSDEDLRRDDFLDNCLSGFRLMHPFIEYLNVAIS